MLYLFTGVPGSGKTLNVVSMLAKRPDLKNRPLFIDGIPDLQIPHEPIPEGESIQTWPKWAPTGAIIVVDECQRIFRPRPSGSKVPDYVSELETHRHRGLDFFFITQHPRLIDANLRSLIEHHTHVSKTELGVRRKLEWSTGGAKNPESRADVRDALKSVYKLDKSVYGLYKSAEEHTKIKTGRSKVFYLIPVILLMIIGGLWGFYDFWGDFKKTIPTPTAQQEVAAPAASPETGGTVGAQAQNGTHGTGQYPEAQTTPEPPQHRQHLTEDDYKPAIDGQPHTAPIYDEFNKAVKTMPYPVACVKNANRCTCYTDQGTPIKGFSKTQCLEFVENGIYNPYKDSNRLTTETTTPKAEAPQGGKVAVMGGKPQQNLMYDNWEERGRDFEGIGGGVVGGGT
ncbi:zonular occludens toxin family protein [Neisseria lactamica]|uniref:zonular occludens toxin family protein n=1 Tax=Neisseria lactamica TaxID=486 RepID=UPI000E594912|nr:zonular occludens toxin domain-containing protein [Neisseria lactamica]